MRRFACLVGVLFLAGCAGTPARLQLGGMASEQPLVWPAAPEQARYRYLGTLTGEANFVRDPSTLSLGRKAFDWLVGLAGSPRRARILQRPMAGYTDEQGRVVVADVSRAAVYVFDDAAGDLQIWEMAAEQKRFESPVAVTAGANGETLVSDADLGIVVRLDNAGRAVGRLSATTLKRPTGIARDARRGHVFVADAGAHDIKVFRDDGELLQTIGQRGEGDGEFNAPTYLTFAGDRLYVTDTLNSRVQVFDAEGEFLRSFGRRGLFLGDLPRPKGVAVDRHGLVYVVESYYDYLLVFDSEGRFLLPIGGSGNGIGQFYLPAGVWTDDRDRIYLADAFNGRVVILQYLGGDK